MKKYPTMTYDVFEPYALESLAAARWLTSGVLGQQVIARYKQDGEEGGLRLSLVDTFTHLGRLKRDDFVTREELKLGRRKSHVFIITDMGRERLAELQAVAAKRPVAGIGREGGLAL